MSTHVETSLARHRRARFGRRCMGMLFAMFLFASLVPKGFADDPAKAFLGSPVSIAFSRHSASSISPASSSSELLLQPSNFGGELAQPATIPGTLTPPVPRPIPDNAQPPGMTNQRPTVAGRDVGCRAASNWMPADLLRARGRTLVQLYCDENECSRFAARALSNFLHIQAEYQEDIGAASGLRAYYSRIALVEQQALIAESFATLEEEFAKQQAIQVGGLSAGVDMTSFDRQRIEIRDKQLRVVSQDRQLRAVLAQIATLDYESSSVRHEQLEIFESPLDCARLQQQALLLRCDLRAWIYLSHQVNEETAPIFAKMIPTLVGGWVIPIPAIISLKQLFCPPDYSCFAANMKQELQLTIETNQKWICQTVEEKCYKLQLTYDRIKLAQEMIASWEARLSQLDRLDEKGDGQAEARALARTELIKARSEEVSRRLDAKLAEVDLAEATGQLAKRCCEGKPWLLTGYE